MIKKSNVWAKTVLSVYRYLDRICDAIDKLVERRALNSFYVTTSNLNGIECVANAIIDLIERKVKLINLKLAAQFALEEMDPLCAQILIEKYVDGDKANDIAGRHHMPMRTYFRKLQIGEQNFMKALDKFGHGEEKLEESMQSEKWILQVYSRFSSESREDVFEYTENSFEFAQS